MSAHDDPFVELRGEVLREHVDIIDAVAQTMPGGRSCSYATARVAPEKRGSIAPVPAVASIQRESAMETPMTDHEAAAWRLMCERLVQFPLELGEDTD